MPIAKSILVVLQVSMEAFEFVFFLRCPRYARINAGKDDFAIAKRTFRLPWNAKRGKHDRCQTCPPLF